MATAALPCERRIPVGLSLVLHQILVLFLMMAAGFAANRLGVMDQISEQKFSRLIVNITCPALILSSVTTSGRLESSGALLMVFAAAVVYFLLLPLLARGVVALLRIPAGQAADYECMLLYSNLGFMGIPVAGAVLGSDSILYLSIFMAVFNISIFSYGTLRLGQGQGGVSVKKMVNPGTVSGLAAIALYLLEIQLPPVLLQPVTSLGGITTPLAMLVIGSSLARQPLREVLRQTTLLPLAAIRLLGLPFLCFAVCRWFIADPLLLGIMVLVSAMPVASNNVMICNELERDSDDLAKGVFLTTLLSLFSLPLVSLLLITMV